MVESSAGAALASTAAGPRAIATRRKEIEKARSICPALPVTGTASRFAVGVPATRPRARIERCTARSSAVLAPNRAANPRGVKYA
jgi:hypothetical protein